MAPISITEGRTARARVPPTSTPAAGATKARAAATQHRQYRVPLYRDCRTTVGTMSMLFSSQRHATEQLKSSGLRILRLGGACRRTGHGDRLPRGAACSNSRPQPGAKTFGGLEGGWGWVGWSAGVPRGGSVGTPTYIPQHDPHDKLIILNIHKWGKNFFQKNLPISSVSHQPRSDPEVRSGVKNFSVFFKHFCILHKILSILSIDTWGI